MIRAAYAVALSALVLGIFWSAVDGGEMHVNTMMINEGFAAPYSGGARSPA